MKYKIDDINKKWNYINPRKFSEVLKSLRKLGNLSFHEHTDFTAENFIEEIGRYSVHCNTFRGNEYCIYLYDLSDKEKNDIEWDITFANRASFFEEREQIDDIFKEIRK